MNRTSLTLMEYECAKGLIHLEVFAVRFGLILRLKVIQIARYKSMWSGLVQLTFKMKIKPVEFGLVWLLYFL